MKRPDRVMLVLVALSTLAACGGSPRAPAVSCSGDEQCGEASRCVDHSCIANSPPRASFVIAGDLVSNALVTLDGSASADPDERDEVTAHEWTIHATAAPCAPPTVADTTPVARVRFGCAGAYTIRLVVKDAMGAASQEASRDVTIAAGSTGQVSAGIDQAVQHACAGAPLVCGLATAVRLAGAVSSTPSGTFTYQWTVVAPANRPLGATRRVRFTPSANVLAPTVAVEADGAAVSGDWVFHLEVRDGESPVGSDDMRLSVGNRPPVVKLTGQDAYAHTYDAAGRTYGSSGTVALQLSDPDGDPVTRKIEWRHTGDGGGQFDGQASAASVTFRIAVTDPLWLRGTADRTIAAIAEDVNGGSTTASVPIVVGNRAPTLGGGSVTAGHTFTTSTSTFSSTAQVGTWADPDGDPLMVVTATGDPQCTSSVHTDGTAHVTCAAPYSGIDSLARFVGTRRFAIQASDPWTAGSGSVALSITNRAPVVAGSTVHPPIACVVGSAFSLCCEWLYSTCRTYGNEYAGGTFSVSLGVSDPDGDPLQVSARSASTPLAVSCPGGACTGTLQLSPSQSCQGLPTRSIQTEASDGVDLTSGASTIAPRCR